MFLTETHMFMGTSPSVSTALRGLPGCPLLSATLSSGLAVLGPHTARQLLVVPDPDRWTSSLSSAHCCPPLSPPSAPHPGPTTQCPACLIFAPCWPPNAISNCMSAPKLFPKPRPTPQPPAGDGRPLAISPATGTPLSSFIHPAEHELSVGLELPRKTRSPWCRPTEPHSLVSEPYGCPGGREHLSQARHKAMAPALGSANTPQTENVAGTVGGGAGGSE